MYCTNCGEKLADGAVFCGACGCRVDQGDVGLSQGSGVSQGSSVSLLQPQPQPQSQQERQLVVVQTEQSHRPSFASFLMERRQVGKAMVPTFAIILAMLIAAAGTAYALVKAYEVFVEPAIERRAEQHSESKPTDQKKDTAAKKDDPAAENKKAHAAYDEIVDLYKTYGDYCEEAGPGAGTTEGLKEKLAEFGDYSYMGIYVYLKSVDPDEEQALYLMKDLDGDGVDEMLVAERFEGTGDSSLHLVNFYYFEDGKARSIFDSIGDGQPTSTLPGNGFLIMGESQGVELGRDGTIILDTHQDRFSATYCFDYGSGKLSLQDALQINVDKVSNVETSCKVTTIENGSEQPEEKVLDWDSASAGRDEFYSSHRASSENDKLLSGNDWVLIK